MHPNCIIRTPKSLRMTNWVIVDHRLGRCTSISWKPQPADGCATSQLVVDNHPVCHRETLRSSYNTISTRWDMKEYYKQTITTRKNDWKLSLCFVFLSKTVNDCLGVVYPSTCIHFQSFLGVGSGLLENPPAPL